MRLQRGQSPMEYVLLLIIVMGAFLATQTYIKRGFQGRWKEAVDELGDQYDPTVMNSNIRYSLTSNTVTQIKIVNSLNGFWTNRMDSSNSTEQKTGFSAVGGL